MPDTCLVAVVMGSKSDWSTMRHAAELLHDGLRVGVAEEGFDLRIPRPALAAIQVVRVFLLNLGRIEQHDSRDGRCGGRAIDRAFKARLDRHGQLAAVIEVAVREDDRIGFRYVVRQICVDPPRIVAPAYVRCRASAGQKKPRRAACRRG